jgi:hypothetical protein
LLQTLGFLLEPVTQNQAAGFGAGASAGAGGASAPVADGAQQDGATGAQQDGCGAQHVGWGAQQLLLLQRLQRLRWQQLFPQLLLFPQQLLWPAQVLQLFPPAQVLQLLPQPLLQPQLFCLQHFCLQPQLRASTSDALMARLTVATTTAASDNSLRVIAFSPWD